MSAWRERLARVAGMFRGRRREDELDEEIASHVALLIDDFRRRGLSEYEARLAARREFGGVAQTREAFRDQRRLPSIDALIQDVRFATRSLARDRATALAAVLLLTIGVGATVVMVDVLDRLLVRAPDHIDRPDLARRVYVQVTGRGEPGVLTTNQTNMDRLAAGTRDAIAWIATFRSERIGFGHGARATRVEAVSHSEAYFDVLGMTPAIGVFPSAGRKGAPDPLVLSHAFWHQHFGGRPDVIGTPMRLGTRVYTVVAVTPRGFAGIGNERVDVWLPLEGRMPSEWRTSDTYYSLNAIARLRPGVPLERAEAQATDVYNAVDTTPWANGRRPHVSVVLGDLALARAPGGTSRGRLITAIAGVSVLVLLIACGNVGSLLLLRGLRRGRELALKTALGATRARLLRELLVEALLLAAAAGCCALMVVGAVGGLVRGFALPSLPTTAAPLDMRVTMLTAGACLLAAFLLGLAPAVRLTTRHALNPWRASRGGRSSRLLDVFVGVQVGMSVPLLVGTALFATSFWQALRVDFGMDVQRLAVVQANMIDDGRPKENHEVHRRIATRLSEVPGVRASTMVFTVPMVSAVATWLEVPGKGPVEMPSGSPFVNGVDASFIEVMGLKIVGGRSFTDAENTSGARPVAVINEAMARAYWPSEVPLGRCLHVNGPAGGCTEIIGVVANASAWADLDYSAATQNPIVWLPAERFTNIYPERALLVRAQDAPGPLLARLRQGAQRAGTDLPYIDAWELTDVLQPALMPLRLGSMVFFALGALALVIAVAGLAVVTAHGVTRRTREVAIRLVLGADPGDLTRLMLRRTLVAVVLGLAAGSIASFLGRQLLKSLLFGIEPGDPRVYLASAAVLLAAGTLAAYLPARRASRIEPVDALRCE